MEEVFDGLRKILAIPLIIAFVLWAIDYLSNPSSPESIEKSGELIAKAAIPWWVPVLQTLASPGGIVSAILVIIFLIFLVRTRGA